VSRAKLWLYHVGHEQSQSYKFEKLESCVLLLRTVLRLVRAGTRLAPLSAQVVDALQRIGRLGVSSILRPIVPCADVYGYRNKACPAAMCVRHGGHCTRCQPAAHRVVAAA
jgi:hypothetical protein